MVQTIGTSTNEELLEFIIGSLKSDKGEFPIFDDDLSIVVKMHGEQWNGQINYQVANFIIELQNRILGAYNEAHGVKHNFASLKTFNKNLVINVNVNPGCTELIAKAGEVLQAMSGAIQNMESKDIKQTMIAGFCVYALTTGGQGFFGYLNTVEATKRISSEQANVKEAIHTLEKIALKQMEPLHYLAKEMAEGDVMEYAGKSYTRQEALTKFPKIYDEQPSDLAKTYYADGRYEVAILDFTKNNVHIAKDGKRFPVETKLMLAEEKETLHKLYRDADITQTVPSVDIQLTVEALQGKIISATIIGLGEPRPSARPLVEILKESMVAKETKGLQQANLLE